VKIGELKPAKKVSPATAFEPEEIEETEESEMEPAEMAEVAEHVLVLHGIDTK
jgi:hypothetical protein